MYSNNVEGKPFFTEQLQLLNVVVKEYQHFASSNEIMNDRSTDGLAVIPSTKCRLQFFLHLFVLGRSTSYICTHVYKET